jgi:hypothetical protein
LALLNLDIAEIALCGVVPMIPVGLLMIIIEEAGIAIAGQLL